MFLIKKFIFKANNTVIKKDLNTIFWSYCKRLFVLCCIGLFFLSERMTKKKTKRKKYQQIKRKVNNFLKKSCAGTQQSFLICKNKWFKSANKSFRFFLRKIKLRRVQLFWIFIASFFVQLLVCFAHIAKHNFACVGSSEIGRYVGMKI